MRVTNKIMADTMTSNLMKQTERLYDSQKTVSSGKKVLKPSDDPIGMGRILGYRTTLNAFSQYEDNMARAKTRMELNDSAMDYIREQLVTARSIAKSAMTDDETGRSIAAEQIRLMREQIVQMGNTSLEGQYIFAGHETQTQPFAENAGGQIVFNGDGGIVRTIVTQDIELQLNVTGADLFSVAPGGVVPVLDALNEIQLELDKPTSDPNPLLRFDRTRVEALIPDLDDAINQVEKVQVQNGARLGSLKDTQELLDNLKIKIEDMLYNVEQADPVSSVVEFKAHENAYQTSLEVASRVILPSLVNFLG